MAYSYHFPNKFSISWPVFFSANDLKELAEKKALRELFGLNEKARKNQKEDSFFLILDTDNFPSSNQPLQASFPTS